MDRRKFILGSSSLVAINMQTSADAGVLVTVTHIAIVKSERKLMVMGGRRVLKSYKIALGHTPVGHKQFQGDGKTPEGVYRIDRKNRGSRFYRSIGIDYPNANDRAFARRRGRSPGGDIFIHGQPNGKKGVARGDWTRGCIAIRNDQMDELWALTRLGMKVAIYA